MFPTSLPGGSPGGITAARPTSPVAANRARFGIEAACSGVRPPSTSIGSSAQPSGTSTMYFMSPWSRTRARTPKSLLRPHPYIADMVLRGEITSGSAVTLVRMRSRRSSLVALALLLVAAACSGGNDSAAPATTGQTTTTTTPSTTASAPPTTTVPANLGAARVTLTQVAPMTGAIAIAVRAGDPALYVAQQTGKIVAIRDGQSTRRPCSTSVAVSSPAGSRACSASRSRRTARSSTSTTPRPTATPDLEEYAFADGKADPALAATGAVDPGPAAEPQRRQHRVRARRLPLSRQRRRRRRRRPGAGHAPGGNGQSLDTLLGQAPAHRPDRERRAAVHDPGRQPVRRWRRASGDLGLRAAQPVAVLVRPRRPATCGSPTSARTCTRRSTSCPRARARARTTAGTDSRAPTLPGNRTRRCRGTRPRPPPRRRLLRGRRRLRVPRHEDPRSARCLSLRRQLPAADQGDPRRERARLSPIATSACPWRSRRPSARTPPGTSTSCR